MRRTRRAPKFALSCGASRRAWHSDCVHESEIGSESESPRSRWLTIPVVYCNAASPTRQVAHWQAPTRSPTRRPSECPSHSASQGGDWSSGRSPPLHCDRSSSSTSGDRDSESPTRTGAESWDQAPNLDSNPRRQCQCQCQWPGQEHRSRPRPGAFKLEPDPVLTRRTSERGACHGHGPSRGPPSPQAQARDARTTTRGSLNPSPKCGCQ